jgi:hypothetical protein
MVYTRLKVNDIINYDDAKGTTYTGVVVNVVLKENPSMYGTSYSRFAVIRSAVAGKMKKVNIMMSKATFEKYKVELRYRPGVDDYIPANNAPVTE